MAQPGAFAGQCRKAAAEEPLVVNSLMQSLGGERVDNCVNWASLYFCERYNIVESLMEVTPAKCPCSIEFESLGC